MIALNLLIESIGVLAIGVFLGLYWFGSWLHGDVPQKPVRLGHLVLTAGSAVAALVYLVVSTTATISQPVLASSLPSGLPTRSPVLYNFRGSIPTPEVVTTSTTEPLQENTPFSVIDTPSAVPSPVISTVPSVPTQTPTIEALLLTARATPTPMCRGRNLRITYPRRGETLNTSPIEIRGAVYAGEGTAYAQIILEASISEAEPYNGVNPGWPISVTVGLQPTGGSDFEGLLGMWDWQNPDPKKGESLEGKKVWLRLRAKKTDGNADVLSDDCLVWISLEHP